MSEMNNMHRNSIVSDKSLRQKKRSITIIGDSIIKDIKCYEMQKHLPPNTKLFMKSFPGATTECMPDYTKPSLKHNPDLIIMHAGTNDLRSNKSPEGIADDILSLCDQMKTVKNDLERTLKVSSVLD